MLEEINQGANFLRKLILREAKSLSTDLDQSVLRWGVNINPVLSTLSGLQLALLAADL